jgi:uncharacterized spore protein YtfJ
MNVDELVRTAKDSMTVRRVYGDALEHDGVTIIPAATVAGGLGGGTGKDPKGQEGEGGGFGMTGRPVGVFVLRDGQVSWRPAVDVNRVVGILGVVVAAYVLMRPRMARIRAAS